MKSAAERRDADRRLNRVVWIIVSVLLAWVVLGFFREPRASWQEQLIVGLVAGCFAAPMLLDSGFSRTLPALDRTPRTATVTGRSIVNAEPEGDSEVPIYELVVVTVETGGTGVDTTIADIIAADSLDRFTIGSTWQVYAFEDPTALNRHPGRTRVLLTEAHDDIIRAGYDLGYYCVHDEPGPGSDLLLRRFANDG